MPAYQVTFDVTNTGSALGGDVSPDFPFPPCFFVEWASTPFFSGPTTLPTPPRVGERASLDPQRIHQHCSRAKPDGSGIDHAFAV